MAQFDDPLPALAFPCELDSLAIQCDNSNPLLLTMRIGGQSGTTILETTLYPDSADMVYLNDLATLLQDNLSPRAVSEVYFGLDTHAESVMVIPSRANISRSAEDFTAQHFLTLLDGARPTYLGAQEWLAYYATATQPTPIVTCLWVNPTTGETREAPGSINSVTHYGNNLHTVYFQPHLFVRPADGFILHSFRVELGGRRQDYILVEPTDCTPLSLKFCNNFGQSETFHLFGTMEKELKPTRSTASFSGKTRNYRIEAVPTWKCHTGVLAPSVQPLFADLCAAKEVVRLDNGADVTITDNELKLSTDRYSVQTGSITFREAARSARFTKQNVRRQTFDNTFDNTFE